MLFWFNFRCLCYNINTAVSLHGLSTISLTIPWMVSFLSLAFVKDLILCLGCGWLATEFHIAKSFLKSFFFYLRNWIIIFNQHKVPFTSLISFFTCSIIFWWIFCTTHIWLWVKLSFILYNIQTAAMRQAYILWMQWACIQVMQCKILLQQLLRFFI